MWKFAEENGLKEVFEIRMGAKHKKIFLKGVFVGCIPQREGAGGDHGIKNLYAQLRRAMKDMTNDSVPGRAP